MSNRWAATLDPGFSLLHDPLLRLQRALRLAPRHGFAAPRRALLLVAVTWLPIMVWAAINGRLGTGLGDESVLRHLGVHVRCLLGIPLLVLSEPLADRILGLIVGNFPASGLVRPEHRSAFDAVVRSVERLRDSMPVWVALAGAVIVLTTLGAQSGLTMGEGAAAGDFGGAWARLLVRPLFLFMLLAWLWRLVLTWVLFRRIANLGLFLVPAHPDRVGGLGFIELHSMAFSLVILAISGVFCASAAHEMLVHGVRLMQLKAPLASLVVLLAILFILPLTAFSGALRRALMRGRFEYGTVAGRHIRGVHARWVEGRPVEDEAILVAPEIGPAADVATLYDLGTRMRMAPIGKLALGAVLVPALLPVLCVATLEVPLKDILLKLLGAIR